MQAAWTTPARIAKNVARVCAMCGRRPRSATIPLVFGPWPDPVRSGLVASMNRPGGNITGMAALTIELDPKRLELLHELAPPGPLGVLLNPTRPDGHVQVDAIKAAAQTVNRPLVVWRRRARWLRSMPPSRCSRKNLSLGCCRAPMRFSQARGRILLYSPRATAGLRSTNGVSLWKPADSQATDRACSTPI